MARLLHRLRQGDFTVTVEIDPPKGPDPHEVIEKVRRFGDRVDAVNVADCPLANVRMSPITLAHLLQRDVGVECIFHLTTRDRNLIGLQAELLGAAGLGVRNILCLRGDDPDRGDQPDATGVFQVDASGLARIAQTLNRGLTLSGKELDAPTDFAIGVAANPTNPNPDAEVDRILQKIEGGAHFAQTQPIFDPDDVERFQEVLARRGVDFPILYGILPLKSHKNALYMAKNVPGIKVPPAVVERMEKGDQDEGIRIAGEIIQRLHQHRIHGVHLFPLNSTRIVLGVLDILEQLGIRRSHPEFVATAARRGGRDATEATA